MINSVDSVNIVGDNTKLYVDVFGVIQVQSYNTTFNVDRMITIHDDKYLQLQHHDCTMLMKADKDKENKMSEFLYKWNTAKINHLKDKSAKDFKSFLLYLINVVNIVMVNTTGWDDDGDEEPRVTYKARDGIIYIEFEDWGVDVDALSKKFKNSEAMDGNLASKSIIVKFEHEGGPYK